MASIAEAESTVGRQPLPDILSGALAGGITTLAFTMVHGIWIANIWFNVVPMVLAGAGCGAAIVWSYRKSVASHAWSKWLAYNGACALLLLGLGAASFLVFEPRFTMAELIDSDDALARVLPPAMPLIGAGTVVGTFALWLMFGRGTLALLSILTTQALLMFLVGHNLAILGLVDIPTDQLYRVFEFVGLTLFLAAGFAASASAVSVIRTRE